jgi:hydroxypyruvate isomerase
MEHNSSRRKALKNLMLSTMAGTTLSSFAEEDKNKPTNTLKGNINHSACRWCYADIPLEQLCAAGKEIGLKAIDLVGPKDWPMLQKYGLHSSMCNGAEININKGWNNPIYHEQLIKNYTEMIPLVAQAGYTNLICFSGARKGLDDETGLKNCADGLKQVLSMFAFAK